MAAEFLRPEAGGPEAGGPFARRARGPEAHKGARRGCSPPLGARDRDRHMDLTLVGNIGFLVALPRFFIL